MGLLDPKATLHTNSIGISQKRHSRPYVFIYSQVCVNNASQWNPLKVNLTLRYIKVKNFHPYQHSRALEARWSLIMQLYLFWLRHWCALAELELYDMPLGIMEVNLSSSMPSCICHIERNICDNFTVLDFETRSLMAHTLTWIEKLMEVTLITKLYPLKKCAALARISIYQILYHCLRPSCICLSMNEGL